jgi:hypothetical protein
MNSETKDLSLKCSQCWNTRPATTNTLDNSRKELRATYAGLLETMTATRKSRNETAQMKNCEN